MKVLNRENGTFFHGAGSKMRIWHTCEGYKGGKRGTIRAELEKILHEPANGEEFTEEEKEAINYQSYVYQCPHCGFTVEADQKLKAV